jgi:hypothetical protein
MFDKFFCSKLNQKEVSLKDAINYTATSIYKKLEPEDEQVFSPVFSLTLALLVRVFILGIICSGIWELGLLTTTLLTVFHISQIGILPVDLLSPNHFVLFLYGLISIVVLYGLYKIVIRMLDLKIAECKLEEK